MNVGPITSFDYPYGEYNADSIQAVKDAGFTNARTTIDGYATPTADPYQLPRLGLYSNTALDQVKQWIDQAVAKKEWLIFAFHRIDTSGDTYSTTPSDFNQIVDYLKQKNVQVVTMSQGYQALQK